MKRIQKIVLVVFLITVIGFGAFVAMRYTGRDTEGPVIKDQNKEIEASIQDSDEKLLEGIQAMDEKDGDVSDSLIIESRKVDKDGACILTYAAFDNSNNVSKGRRTVSFTDYHSPHFTINKPLRFVLGSKNEILECLGAQDCIDGDISNRIKLVKESDNDEYVGEGIYNYQLEVTNSFGDTAVLPISVEYYVDSYEERIYHPNLYLSSHVVYVAKGSTFDPKSYLDSMKIGNSLYVFSENMGSNSEAGSEEAVMVTEDGQTVASVISYSKVKYQSDVDTSRTGNYTVEYSYVSDDGYMGTTQLIVVVE